MTVMLNVLNNVKALFLQRTVGRFSTLDHVFVALLWFVFSAQWMTVVPVIVPDQVTTIVRNAPDKEGVSGTIIAAGACVALCVAPLAGALSDRRRAPYGRRRPFLILGMLGTCLGLALMLPFGPGSSVLLYLLAFLHLQFWWNWAAGPYAGLIPDVVPAPEYGIASGWMNVMSVVGMIVGNAVMWGFYAPGHPAVVVGIFIGFTLICLALTVAGVREPASTGHDQPFDLSAFVRSFYLPPHEHGNFYWVLVTRLLANLGMWSIFTFLLFYLQDVIAVANAASILPMLLGGGALLAIPASLVGVWMADRYGLVKTVQGSSWVMAVAALCYVLIAFHPNLVLVVLVALVYGVGFGAYQAVDWALALRVLPSTDTAGKDMGIWHISMVLPQIIGPAATGWLISGVKVAVSARFAYTVAFGIAALWFILAAVLVARVRIAHRV